MCAAYRESIVCGNEPPGDWIDEPPGARSGDGPVSLARSEDRLRRNTHLSQHFRGEARLAFRGDGFFKQRDILEELRLDGRRGAGRLAKGQLAGMSVRGGPDRVPFHRRAHSHHATQV